MRLDLDLSSRRVDLIAERYDIAVRAAERLPDDSTLVARPISVLRSGLYASPDRKVPGELRELGQTRAGWLVGSQFVFSQHCKACRGYGFSDDKIEALKAWAVSDLFSPLERALLATVNAG